MHAGLLLILLGASAAAAQDGEDPRAAFRAGEAAFAAGNSETALSHFRRAYMLSPHDAVRFNIGVCLDQLGRLEEALVEYEAAASSEAVNDTLRGRAREGADRVRGQLGVLLVEGRPEGADVFIDGRARCQLPCRLSIDPGSYSVEVRGESGQVARDTVEIRRAATATLHLVAVEVVPAPTAPAPAAPAEASPSSGPSWLLFTGIGLAAAGGAGIIGFGLHTAALEEQFHDAPTLELQDEGVLMRTLTNVSIGVACLGGVLIAIDLIRMLLANGDERPRSARLSTFSF